MSQVIPPESNSSVVSPAAQAPLRHVVVSGFQWQSVLDFTQLFRGFRLAINPAKILLAVMAILAIYTAGRLFDFAWGPQVYKDEIETYQVEKPDRFKLEREDHLRGRSTDLQQQLRQAFAADDDTPSTDDIGEIAQSPRRAYRQLKAMHEQRFQKDVAEAHGRKLQADKDKSTFSNDTLSPAQAEQDERAAAAKALFERVQRAKETAGQGIFDAFLGYEIRQFDALVDNTLTFVRVAPVRSTNFSGTEIEGSAVSGGLLSKDPSRLWQSDTVAGCIANMAITGPKWLFTGAAPMQWHSGAGRDYGAEPEPDTWLTWGKMVVYRGMYLVSLILLAVFSLIVLALTGAIISRLSALEIAGVEHAPLKDVFTFAVRRLWVFVKAPVTPFLILLAIGVMLALAGLIGAIPFIGEIILGVMFIVFLVGGFVLMLLLLGILGGFNLLYPTIAVEGSDAFDAMSRSFAYVYARPWRLLFYSVISLIYGVITFLFVSFAIYLVLSLSHTFAGWGTSLMGYNHGWYSGSPKLDTLWPAPDFARKFSTPNWYAMSVTEYIGAMFLNFWTYLLISVSGAYVLSYYFSTHTIMYLLLRKSVDGQAITEIYVDEVEPAIAPAEAATALGAAPAVSTPPAV